MKSTFHDLSVDDIHNIRVENSKLTEKMSCEEITSYLERETKDFRNLLKKDKDLAIS